MTKEKPPKKRINAVIEAKYSIFIDEMIEKKRFGSITHAIEVALEELMKRYKEGTWQ